MIQITSSELKSMIVLAETNPAMKEALENVAIIFALSGSPDLIGSCGYDAYSYEIDGGMAGTPGY